MFKIAHLTDFSPGSEMAFAHALRLAVGYRDTTLFILHAQKPFTDREWASFPRVRKTLAGWGYMSESEPTAAIEAKTGVRVAKIEVDSPGLSYGLSRFLREHRPDLIVVSTAGREGWAKWFEPSMAEGIFHRLHCPTLFLRADMSGFVGASGALDLSRVLVPVAADATAQKAAEAVTRFLAPLGIAADALDFVHVAGKHATAPGAGTFPVRIIAGSSVEDGILAEAAARGAKLIVMPSHGPETLSERLWGSTTERVIHHAPCPVLAVPV